MWSIIMALAVIVVIFVAGYLIITKGIAAMPIEPKGVIVGAAWIILGVILLVVCFAILGVQLPG